DLHVHVFGLGQHGDRNSGSVHATLLFGLGHALHAVNAALILHARVHAFTFDDGDDFLQPAHARLRRGEHLHFPALALRVARVHPENLRGKKRGFVTTCAGADFEYYVLLVVGILGYKQDFEFGLSRGQPFFQTRKLFLGVSPQLSIRLLRDHRLALFDPTLHVLVFTVLLHDLRELSVSFGGLLVARRIPNRLRRRQGAGKFVVFRLDLVQPFKHGVLSIVAGD